MADVLTDIETALVDAGVGVAYDGLTAWSIAHGYESETPDQQIVIQERPGTRPDTNWSTRFPQFRVIVRGLERDYAATRTKADAVFDALHANTTAEGKGAGFVHIHCLTSAPLFMGYDVNDRPIFVWDFETARNQ